MNKKFMPVGIILAVLVLLLGGFVAMRGRNASTSDTEEENIPELPVAQRPFTTLTPTEDGHYLKLVINDINVPGASLVQYEVFYDTAAGNTQGIKGKATLTGVQTIDRDILLGSESSGNFRYDEGVDDGKLKLVFRDVDGKSIGKVETTWRLYNNEQDLSSDDGQFIYSLSDVTEDYFVVMNTFGLPAGYSDLSSGPYGVFASGESEYPGNLNTSFSQFDGDSWSAPSASADNIGIFVK